MAFLPMSGDLDDRAQGRDDPGRALIFRPHHPIGDKAETDLARGIGEADLTACAVMSETAIGKIAPGLGIELEAVAPAGIRWIAAKDRDTLALRPRCLGDDRGIEQPDAACRRHRGRP